MEQYLKDFLKKTILQGGEQLFIIIKIYLRENFLMIKQMDMGIIYIKMAKIKQVIGLMIIYLELDMKQIIMNIIQVNLKKEKKMAQGHLNQIIKVLYYMKEN